MICFRFWNRQERDTLTQVQEGGLKNAATMPGTPPIVPGTWSELEALLKAVLYLFRILILGEKTHQNQKNSRHKGQQATG